MTLAAVVVEVEAVVETVIGAVVAVVIQTVVAAVIQAVAGVSRLGYLPQVGDCFHPEAY